MGILLVWSLIAVEFLCFYPFNLMLAIGLLYIGFTVFGYVPCISALSLFNINECWILSKAFSVSNEMTRCFFLSVYVVDYIVGLHVVFTSISYIEPPLYLWNKAYLIMVDDVFNVFLDLVC